MTDTTTKSNLFQPGNPGKPKGSVNVVKRELAKVCREYVEDQFEDTITRLLNSSSDKVVLQTLEFLTERGWGKVPDVIKMGVDDDSAVGVMMKIAAKRRAVSDHQRPSEEEDET